MNVSISPLSGDPVEITEVQKFLFKMIKKEFGYGYVPKWHHDIINLEDYYVNPKRNSFFIAYSETGEILGTIGIRAYDKDFPQFRHLYSKEKTSSIWRLFIDKRYRRCGLASKMFSLVENFANQAGYDEIYLHTEKTSSGARAFWKKMGFVVTLETNDDIDTIHMDKKIRELEINYLGDDFTHDVNYNFSRICDNSII